MNSNILFENIKRKEFQVIKTFYVNIFKNDGELAFICFGVYFSVVSPDSVSIHLNRAA